MRRNVRSCARKLWGLLDGTDFSSGGKGRSVHQPLARRRLDTALQQQGRRSPWLIRADLALLIWRRVTTDVAMLTGSPSGTCKAVEPLAASPPFQGPGGRSGRQAPVHSLWPGPRPRVRGRTVLSQTCSRWAACPGGGRPIRTNARHYVGPARPSAPGSECHTVRDKNVTLWAIFVTVPATSGFRQSLARREDLREPPAVGSP
jgi:hypothetical protein